jgi:Spy/CpxP family protein refolding chaperone
MKRIPPVLIFQAAILLLLAALPAAAQHPRRGHGPDHRDPARALNLTEEQREQFQAAHEAHREAIEPLLEQLHAHHDAVETAIETGDPATVGEAVLAGHALREQLEAERKDLEAAVLEILDEEQKARYLELRQRRRSFDGPGMGGHLQHRRMREPGGAQ